MSSSADEGVAGVDIEALIRDFGWSVEEARFALGLSAPAFGEVVRAKARKNKEKHSETAPVKNPTLALLVRVLLACPEAAIIPKVPTAEEIATLLSSLDPDLKHRRALAIACGREASGGYRYLTLGTKQTAVMQRLYYAIQKFLENPETRAQRFAQYMGFVKSEAKARGVDDVFKAGRWSNKPKQEPKAEDTPGIPAAGAKSSG